MALIVGSIGYGPAVEVYSPDGGCQHRLASLPIGGLFHFSPTLAFVDDKILSCAGGGDGSGTVSRDVPSSSTLKANGLGVHFDCREGNQRLFQGSLQHQK